MKKRIFSLISILLCGGILITGCNNNNNDDSSSSGEQKTPVINVTDSALVMDCFDTYALETELEHVETVTWSSSDPSVLSVDANGVLTTGLKEGKATITASGNGVSDTCEVTVMVQGNPPALVTENQILISEGGVYATNATVTYNGQDITEHVTLGVSAISGQSVATAAVENGRVTYTANDVGVAEFSVYTNVFGKLYAEQVSVEVKNTDLAYVVSGESDQGLLLTVGKEVSTSDVSVFYQGNKVDNAQLTWTVEDDSIVTISDGGKLVMGNEGSTRIISEYQGGVIAVNVSVEKLRESVEVVQTELPYVNLDAQIVITDFVYPDQGNRAYVVNETNVDTLTLPNVIAGGRVVRAIVGERELDASCFAYADGVVTMQTKVFGLDAYGQQQLTLYVEGVDTVYSYTMNVILVTKSVSTLQEMKDAIVVLWRGDRITGYFTLGTDLDFGDRAYAEYATNWNYLDGFRGTFDGAGYKIVNYKPNNYGLTSQIGEGAVFKNLVFENVNYQGDVTCLFGRGAKNATFENITVASFNTQSTFKQASNTEVDYGGLFVGHQVLDCTFKNITVHAEGKNLYSLVGGKIGEQINCVYENVVVYANSVRYYATSKSRPDGITFTKA